MKKNKIAIQLLLTGAFALTVISGCKKSYFDINENPNSPATASVKELLPSAEAAIALAVGNNLQINGGLWAQYWTQNPSSSQYKTIEQYSPASNDYDRPWKALYGDALEDLKTIISKGTADGASNYIACSKILEAYSFQVLTDNWGDIPFSQALRAEEGILSPAYDQQSAVYDGIIQLAKDGIAAIDENSDIVPGNDDLLLGGNMAVWREFGNTLLLRIYLRMAYVNPSKAAAGIAELQAGGATFLAQGEEVRIDYASAGGNTNPLYSSIIALGFIQNLVASGTAVDYMLANNDARLDAFYFPSTSGQIGIPQGAYDLPAGTLVSFPGTATGGYGDDASSALAPVKLMTGYESLFLQSEAIARGWLAGDAETTYRDAITENFSSYGITGDTVTYYLDSVPAVAFPSGGTTEDKIKAIITQKWVALCGNGGDEGWIEQRRTGYPDFFVVSVNSAIGAGRFPERFYYPSAEVTRNANFPGQKLIYDKMWWDVN